MVLIITSLACPHNGVSESLRANDVETVRDMSLTCTL